MHFLIQLILGGILILLTFAIQAICFDKIIRIAPWLEKRAVRYFKPMWKSMFFIVVISLITGVLILEIWIWGLFYLAIDALPDLESALYFSTSAFTTVGFGDVYLDKDWRMISSIEAMNGFLLFGWTTAFIWEIVTNMYTKESDILERRARRFDTTQK